VTLRVGLTGGIGSGKSSVSSLLRARGAVVIDADQLAREVMAPGSPGLAAVAEEFGPAAIAADGSLDRAALAAIVFSDPARRRALESITHPRRSQPHRADRSSSTTCRCSWSRGAARCRAGTRSWWSTLRTTYA